MTPPRDAGFTLIEALVAMAVLAVAAAGFVRATEGHIDTIAALETRAAGGWVAENRLAAARVPGLDAAAPPMLGRAWQTTVATAASDDPDIAALTVTAASGGTRAALRGFRDTAPVPPPAPPSPTGGIAATSPAAAAR